MRSMLIAIFSMMTSMSFAAPVGYPMLCRGPLTISFAGSDFLVDFNKPAVAAGLTGENLKSGECGWTDRAISGGEPARLYVDVDPIAANNITAASAVTGATINLLFQRLSERGSLEQSLLNENVVIQMYVYNDGRYFKNVTGQGTGRAYTIYPVKDVAASKPVLRGLSLSAPTTLSPQK